MTQSGRRKVADTRQESPMSRLSVHHQSSPQIPNKVLGHAEDIASTLAVAGIEYRELPLQATVAFGSVITGSFALLNTRSSF